jgi:hypothetical protein
MRNTLEISGIRLAILLSAMAFHAWLIEHDDRLRLEATLATQKRALDAANLREQDRAATLKDALAQIEALKRQTQTPAQILGALPKFLALPQPITLASPHSAAAPTQKGTAQEGTPQQGTGRSENSPCVAKKGCAQSPASATTATNATPNLESSATTAPNQQEHPDASNAQIPAADLKPLFDFVQDCRACQAQPAAAKQDSTDNAAKLAAVTKERGAATPVPVQ